MIGRIVVVDIIFIDEQRSFGSDLRVLTMSGFAF